MDDNRTTFRVKLHRYLMGDIKTLVAQKAMRDELCQLIIRITGVSRPTARRAMQAIHNYENGICCKTLAELESVRGLGKKTAKCLFDLQLVEVSTCPHCSADVCYTHCPKTEDGRHDPDPGSLHVDVDHLRGTIWLVHATCRHCKLLSNANINVDQFVFD